MISCELNCPRNRQHLRAVEVDAINQTAKRFYERYGFLTLSDDPHHLYLPMHIIRKLQLPPL